MAIRGRGALIVVAALAAALPAPAGAQEPDVQHAPKTLDFGRIKPGASSPPQTITWTNRSAAEVSFSAPALHRWYSIADDTCAAGPVAAGASCQTTLVFKPGNELEPVTTRLERTAAGATGTKALRVTLVGRVDRPVYLTPSPVFLRFPRTTLRRTTRVLRVVLTNRASRAATLIAPKITGAQRREFAIKRDGCRGATLAPGAKCAITLTARPRKLGGRRGRLAYGGTSTTVGMLVWGKKAGGR